MNQPILCERDDAVAVVTLNRPDVLNSFNRAMALNLQGVLRDIRDDAGVRAVVLTGAGRAFCAGQDLSEVVPRDGEARELGDIVETSYNPTIRLIREMEKPVICAVNGVAAGAGANLAFACDIVFAAETASFIQSFSKVGLIPDSGGTFLLPRLVGPLKAMELFLLGNRLTAEDAVRMGLVAQAFGAEELNTQVRSIADKLASMPTLGFGLTKRAVNASFGNTLEEQLRLEAELQRVAGASHDYSEGVDAFINKRQPVFRGD